MSAKKTRQPASSSKQIDWKEIRERLEKVQSVIERGWTPDPLEEKNILHKRALALSVETEKEVPGEEIEIVEFLLAQERYGVDVSHVREVHHLNDLAPVPCTPPFVLGIVNVRGQIVSVIDLKKFFELPEKGLGDLDRVIILRSEQMEFGILADSVVSVRRIPLEQLQPALPTLSGIREEYLKGIAADGTIVLDARRLLADRKLIINEEP